ncbi:hypothetical protein ACFRAE_08190 [Sphingobacterium sp. HJSM2_6]|uniref:hypothetical protein n=1 Tax=Sphingobacterium sp. HJSM2_6 TaxID=3366264 RepID=UPI003BC2AFB5
MNFEFNLFDSEIWRVLIYIAIFFWILVWILVIFIIASFQYRTYRYQKSLEKIEPILSEIIEGTLYMENANFDQDVRLNLRGIHVEDTADRRALRFVLKQYYQLLAGDYREFIIRIFRVNNLNKLSLKKLQKSFIYNTEIIATLNDLTIMQEPISDEMAVKFLESKNGQVVRSTRDHLIKLKGLEALPLIFGKINAINKLDVIELYESIRKIKNSNSFKFHPFLKATNHYNLNAILLDLIVNYQEYDSKETLLKLFEVGDNALKVKVVNSIGKLMLYEEESFLIEKYEHESEEVRLEILKALGRLSVGGAIPFLKTQFENIALPISYRKHSLRSIYSLRKTAPGILDELEQHAEEENLKLIKFIKNPLIKYI